MTLIIHPEVIRLKERLTELIYEKENLNSHLCPLIERRYVSKFGIYEYELYRLELDIKKLKRKIQLIRRQINHEENVDLNKIDEKIDAEFQDYEEKLKVQINEINYIKNNEFKKLSDEDSKRLRELYRAIIKELHPDLNPNQTIREKNIFIQATKAFKDGDLAEMESLYVLVPNGELNDEGEIENLQKLIKDMESKIEKIKSEYPYNKKELLIDDKAGTEYKLMLLELIEDRKEDIEKLEKIIKDLI